ncbi:type II toxin-antitoxin system RelE/ParE family toxin [Candidatus Woesearchaeota archaeon]|nr:MAG: type II toxin-antitoxin system RelE/ParE family toxin [Candidatus Woesearchaeota archaeon]
MFDLIFTAQAKKFLKKLDKSESARIIATLERCRVRPHAYAKKLVASPYFRIRAGGYRIIVDISSGDLIILVIEIDHRRRVYK